MVRRPEIRVKLPKIIEAMPKNLQQRSSNYSKKKGNCDNICKTCQKKFDNKQYLRQHEKSHLGIKNYQCTLCEYAAFQKCHLDTHIRFKHTKERPYKCPVTDCGFEVESIGNLKRHQLKHNKNVESLQKFTCSFPECSYETVRKPNFIYHQKSVHSDIRNFKCPVSDCKYAAKWKSHLNQHLKNKHKNKSPSDDPDEFEKVNEVK